MKIVIQRVDNAEVAINNTESGSIDHGMVVLVGFEKTDSREILPAVAQKITSMRIFEDSDGKMNRSLHDINGSLLVIPNFTLAADCTKGNRPSFDSSLTPKDADELFEEFTHLLQQSNISVKTGIFGEHMKITLTNNGPVTFVLEF
ncbi:D-aminoacyl-tRNA deacylase [Candidatus Omnitrophota bacterium]